VVAGFEYNINSITMATEPILFRERQRLPTWALAPIIVLGVGLPLYIAFQQLWLGKPVGDKPMSNRGVAMLVPGIILPALALAGLNLDTRLYRDRLRVRLFPFADENFSLSRIMRWEIRSYSAMKEFMGWGVRSGSGGMAYTMKGNHGLQLILDDGSRVLVGSQRPKDIASALTAASGSSAGTS
jgi:uncharacterized membrane protein (DUF485 family)